MIQGLKCQALEWHPESYEPVQMTGAFMFLLLWKSYLLNCCWINTAAHKARQCKPVSAASCQDSREGAEFAGSIVSTYFYYLFTQGGRVFFHVTLWQRGALWSWQSPQSPLPWGFCWMLGWLNILQQHQIAGLLLPAVFWRPSWWHPLTHS